MKKKSLVFLTLFSLSQLRQNTSNFIYIAAAYCYSIKLSKTKLRGFTPQSELYRPSDRRLSVKLVPTFADRGCRVVSATDPHSR
jgi:hypothetical protein